MKELLNRWFAPDIIKKKKKVKCKQCETICKCSALRITFLSKMWRLEIHDCSSSSEHAFENVNRIFYSKRWWWPYTKFADNLVKRNSWPQVKIIAKNRIELEVQCFLWWFVLGKHLFWNPAAFHYRYSGLKTKTVNFRLSSTAHKSLCLNSLVRHS